MGYFGPILIELGVARETMLAVGCIQAQKCHTGHCPTGVATQNPRLVRGLDPTDKANRTAAYIRTFRHDLGALARAMGVAHPALIRLDQIALRAPDGTMVSGADALPVDATILDDARRARLSLA